jgi:lipopolysaccharide biosynthesis regulator YciM
MLLDRSDLPNDQRVAALHELAQDYLKAGVLDRAESLFLELKGTDFETSASHFLREIYVSEKEWGKAIEVAKKQTGLNASKLLNRDISHYLCELAALDYSHGKAMQADQYIDQALEMNPRCVRASILRGESHFKEGRVKDALKEWLQIEKQNPDYLFLITPSVFSAYKELGQPDIGLKLLQDWLIQYPSLELLSQVYQATIEHQGPDAALALAKHEFYNSPTLPALSKYLEAQINVLGSVHHLATHDSGPLVHNTDRSDLELTQKLVHAQVQKQALFICHHCGFKARQFHWNCPACGHWESYSPRRDTDSEDMASSLVRM